MEDRFTSKNIKVVFCVNTGDTFPQQETQGDLERGPLPRANNKKSQGLGFCREVEVR